MQNAIFPKRDSREAMTLIDTCSLLEVPASELYLKKLMHSRGNVIVPWAVIDELRKKSRSKDPDIRTRAQKIFNVVFDYEARGIITVGLDDDKDSRNFADNIFIGAVFKYGLKNDITVITQDKRLAEDLLNTRNSKSVNGLNISVKRLESDGTLSEVQISDSDPQTERSITSMSINNAFKIPASQLLQKFRNGSEADRKLYKDQFLMFSGKVVRTHREGRELITELSSDDDHFRGRIICRFSENSLHESSSLERGQPVTVSGLLRNVDTYFGDIELSGCSLSLSQRRSSSPRNLFPLRVTSVSDEKTPLTQIPETGSKVKGLYGQEYMLSGIISVVRPAPLFSQAFAAKTGAPEKPTEPAMVRARP